MANGNKLIDQKAIDIIIDSILKAVEIKSNKKSSEGRGKDGKDGRDGKDAPQINDDEALSTNPWSGLKTKEEIAKVEGKIYPCTAQALEDMTQEQQAELYVQGYRAIKTENNGTVVLLGLSADGSLEWLGCNQPSGSLLENPDFSNPINQRGLTTYSGSFIYSIDMWVISGTISLQSGGISVSTNGFFLQRMEPLINGEEYTLAAYFGGQLIIGTITYDSASSDPQIAVSNTLGTLYLQNIDGDLCQFVIAPTAQSIISKPVLLKGSYASKSLPPLEAPDATMELSRCKTLFNVIPSIIIRGIEILDTTLIFNKMRIAPTAKIYSQSGTEGKISIFDNSINQWKDVDVNLTTSKETIRIESNNGTNSYSFSKIELSSDR